MEIQTLKVNSFTSIRTGGNPAGVVLQPEGLSIAQMKRISQLLQVSETAFLFSSDVADYNVRFFSPAVEVDLCGHATIAAFTVLGKQKYNGTNKVIELTQETKAGILPVRLYFTENGDLDYVLMQQQNPVFEPVSFDYTLLADILSISVNQIRSDLPQERVSTGLFTLPVCVSSFSVLKDMKPDFNRVKRFCRKHQIGSLHVFTFDTVEKDSLYHARNFAPLYAIDEDPVTGTANGALCSYLRHHHLTSLKQIKCEQGDIIGKTGRVKISFIDDEVWVGGNAVIKDSKVILL